VHPELDWLIFVEIEQHAAAFRQLLAIHQSDGALGSIGRELDCEGVHAGPGDDLDRLLFGGAGCGRGGEERPAGDQCCGRELRNARQRFSDRL
jgi:hypothetical protein